MSLHGSLTKSLLTFSIFHFLTANSNPTFTPTPPDVPIIINKLASAQLSYDFYKMVLYSDLDPLFKLRFTIKRGLDSSSGLEKILNDPVFTTSYHQLLGQFEATFGDDDLINSYRIKRFILCEWCGTVQHYIIGTMDADTARDWEAKINNQGNLSLSNHELIRNQSSR